MAQIITTCPFCGQQFNASDEAVGTQTCCSSCNAVFVIQKQLVPLTPRHSGQDTVLMILGILGLVLWLIPLFILPIPIVGFILSYNRNYRLGIILNSIALGLSVLWTFTCVLNEMD